MYGDTVCVKYGDHPWWPAIIVPPYDIHESKYDDKHNEHDFYVRFFKTYDGGWIGRSFVYPYAKCNEKQLLNGGQLVKQAIIEAGNWVEKHSETSNDNVISNTKEGEKQSTSSYVKISFNEPVAPAKLIKSNFEPDRCSCRKNDDDPCGPTSNCENRATLVECEADGCPSVGSKCKNQSFQLQKFPSVMRRNMGEKGFGLIAEEFINAGTLVIEYVGQIITEKEFKKRQSQKQSQHSYFMTYAKGLYIDAELKGNESRFVNHSCNPNCEIQVWTVNGINRVGYIALKDIEKVRNI